MRNVLKVNELNKRIKEQAYQESLHRNYEVLRGDNFESVEKKWVQRYSEVCSVLMMHVA